MHIRINKNCDKNIQRYLEKSEKSIGTINLSGRNSIQKNKWLRKKHKIDKVLNKLGFYSLIWTMGLIAILIIGNTISFNIKTETIKLHLLEEVDAYEEIIEEKEDYTEQEIFEIIEEVDEVYNTAPELTPDEDVIKQAEGLLTQFEGMHLKPYWDYKQWSVCYGTKTDNQYKIKTEAECIELLDDRIKTELLRINRSWDLLPAHKKAALISFFYNVGYKHNIMQYAARGDDDSVVYLMSLYNSAGGQYMKWLAKRRTIEINHYKGNE